VFPGYERDMYDQDILATSPMKTKKHENRAWLCGCGGLNMTKYGPHLRIDLNI
jgi:hypothetical protein